MENFFQISEFVIEILAENRKFFQRIARPEYIYQWIFIDQWIRSNKFYKQMKSFFPSFALVFKILAENQKF